MLKCASTITATMYSESLSVCKYVFMEVNGLGEHKYRELQDIAESATSELPTHQSAGRKARNTTAPEVFEQVVPQPAAPRGRAKAAPTYLPATHGKKHVYRDYIQETDDSTMPYSTRLCRICRQHAHDIVVMKPRSDVCADCDKHRQSVKE